MLVDIQLRSAAEDSPQSRDATLQAEADGNDTTWALDRFDGTVLPEGDREMPECCTLLGAWLSSPAAEEYVAAARDAARQRPFELSGWAGIDDQASRAKAEVLELDWLVLARFGPLDR